jgi:hypothetical protein
MKRKLSKKLALPEKEMKKRAKDHLGVDFL